MAVVLAVPACDSQPPQVSDQSGTERVIVPGRPGEDATTVLSGDALPREATQPSAADVTFMQMMIPHHEQAVLMADLAPERAANEQLKVLAERIAAAQAPEIDVMRAWLVAHPEAVVEHSAGGNEAHGEHGGDGDDGAAGGHGGMQGMATQEQLDRLEAARGEEFDRLFVELMTAHHEGAITMSGDALTDGVDLQVQEMATDISVTQGVEIDRMRRLVEP